MQSGQSINPVNAQSIAASKSSPHPMGDEFLPYMKAHLDIVFITIGIILAGTQLYLILKKN